MMDTRTLRMLRSELGQGISLGVDDDDTLEAIYEDEGERDILLTAWYVWKRRLGDLQHRSFDVTTGGSLLSRRQRIAFIVGRIKELEFALGNERLARNRAMNAKITSTFERETMRTEFA